MSVGPEKDTPSDSEKVALIVDVGAALNRSSYPVTETQAVIQDIATAYDFDVTAEVFGTYVVGLDQQVGSTKIEVTGSSYRFDQIAAIESLVRKLRTASIPVTDALAQLKEIADRRPPLNPLIRVVGYALMALGFALCFRMSYAATAAAVLISIPIGAIQIWTSAKGALAALMPFLLTSASALAITLWAVHGGLDDPVRAAVIPVVTLIPGAMLTTSLIELSAGDQIAGASRLVYASVVLLSMAFGLALAIDIVGIGSGQLVDLTAEQAPSWVLWIATPVFAIGNILYFCTPKRAWALTVLFCFGTFWLTNLLQLRMLPAFAGGLALGLALLVAWALNAHMKSSPSVIVMFMPAFWLMVPGSMGFVAISGAITKDHQLSSLGTNAALSLLSMAICMMLAAVLAPIVTHQFSGRKRRDKH